MTKSPFLLIVILGKHPRNATVNPSSHQELATQQCSPGSPSLDTDAVHGDSSL